MGQGWRHGKTRRAAIDDLIEQMDERGPIEEWAMSDPVQKITFAEMRAAGVRGVLIYCSDYRCSHSTASTPIDGPMTSGCPISSRGLSALPAAAEVLTSGRIGNRWSRDPGLRVTARLRVAIEAVGARRNSRGAWEWRPRLGRNGTRSRLTGSCKLRR